ncbi:MAG: transporter [Comamonas sp.]
MSHVLKTQHALRWTAICLLSTIACRPGWATHPLLTDDTAVQGAGGWQLELNTDRSTSHPNGVRHIDQQLNTTLTYGLADTLDLAFSQPTSWQRPSNVGHHSGINDSATGLKWRFWEDKDAGWSMGLRPTITLPIGNAKQGFGNGRSTVDITLLSQLEQGPWQWLINAGLRYNGNTTGERKQMWNASTALLYNLGSSWTFAAELTANRNPNRNAPANLRTAMLGAIYHNSSKTDIDLGLRRNWQRSVEATTVGAGITQRW